MTTAEKLQQLEQQLLQYYQLSRKTQLDEAMQERAAKVKTALQILRKHRKDNAAPPSNQPIGSQIKQDPQELVAAQQLIAAYEAEDTPDDKFEKITKPEFVSALKRRVKDPTGVDQSQLNLCGPAAFMVMWIEREPQSFTQATIELFQKGKSKYKDIELKANKRMFKLDNQKTDKKGRLQYALQLVDWLVLSSLQNAKGLLGYSPDKEMGGIRGIGLPKRVLSWFEALSDGEAKKYRKDLAISQLNQWYASDHYIVLLVNVNKLNDYFSTTYYANPNDTKKEKLSTFFSGITGDHYVVLNSSIETNAKQELVFHIWTWAKDVGIEIPPKEFKKAVVQTFVVEPEKE